MAIINVTFGYAGGKGGPTNQPPLLRTSGFSETISSAASSTQTANTAGSTGYGEGCAAVRVYTDTAVWMQIGKDPTAVANDSIYLFAGDLEFFYVDIGDKLAFLVAT